MKDKLIIRHILEVRLANRTFSFVDNKGKMLDSLSGIFNATNFKLRNDGLRFDLATNDLGKSYFFSYENFGFQLDATKNFDVFKEECQDFFEKLRENTYYTWSGGLLRVGVKSDIFYHKNGETFETVSNKFDVKMLQNKVELETITSHTITDSAFHLDFAVADGRANVLMGPVTKEEAILKFFGDKKALYEKKFESNSAAAFIIDVANKNKLDINNWTLLEQQVTRQINEVEKLYLSLKSYIG